MRAQRNERELLAALLGLKRFLRDENVGLEGDVLEQSSETD